MKITPRPPQLLFCAAILSNINHDKRRQNEEVGMDGFYVLCPVLWNTLICHIKICVYSAGGVWDCAGLLVRPGSSIWTKEAAWFEVEFGVLLMEEETLMETSKLMNYLILHGCINPRLLKVLQHR